MNSRVWLCLRVNFFLFWALWPIVCGFCPIVVGFGLRDFFDWFLANRCLGLGLDTLLFSPCSF